MALGDPGDTPHHIPGNPSPSELGGDNRTDLGCFSAPGNVSPEAAMPNDYGNPMKTPVHCDNAPTPDEVRSMFRGGS